MHSSKETNKYCFAFFGTFLHAFGSIFDTYIKALKITSDRKQKKIQKMLFKESVSLFL